MDTSILVVDLERFGRTKAVSKSVKETMNVRHGEGSLLTPAACFLGRWTKCLKCTSVTLHSTFFPSLYCYCVQEGHVISETT